MKTILLVIAMCFVLYSCAPQVHTTSLKVSLGAITGSANFPGGLYILAKSDTGDEFIEQVPQNDELIIEINNGTWSFAAIGWDSSAGAYEGSAYCDFLQNVSLTGGDFDINLTATKAKCINATSATAFDTSTSDLLGLRIYSCIDIKHHLDIGERIDDPTMDCTGGGNGGGAGPGGDQSFKISLFTKSPTGIVGDGLVSRCISGSGANGNANLADLKVPTGNASIKFPYKIQAFSSTNCTPGTETGIYTFQNGLESEALAAGNLGQSYIDTTSQELELFLHVNRCTGPQLNATPFAITMGSGNDYHLICTADQFINIGVNGTQEHTFEIGKDLDFSTASNPSEGTYSYVPLTFKGEVKGQYQKLKNGDKALFNTFSVRSSGDSTYTGNIFIENFDVAVSASGTNQSYGIFANEIQNSTGNNLEIGSIVIDAGSTLIVNGDFDGYVGGFAGKMTHNSSSSRSYVRRIQTLADVSTGATTATAQYLGGVIGKVIGYNDPWNYGAYLEYISVGKASVPYLNYNDSKQVVVDGFQNVGGVVGSMYNTEMRGLIETNTKIKSSANAGGVIGAVDFDLPNSSVYLRGIDAKTELVPESAFSYHMGGIIGDINQTSSSVGTYQLAAILSEVKVADNGNSIDKLGGLVGNYYSTGFGDLQITNVKSKLDVIIDGNYHGGFVGKYFTNDVSTGFAMGGVLPQVTNSVVVGWIGDNLSIGDYKGGIAGWAKDMDMFRSISYVDVCGDQRLGGAYGYASDSQVYESYIDALVYSGHTSSYDTFVGGVVGELHTDFNLSEHFMSISRVNAVVDIDADIVDCSDADCGIVAGGIASTHASTLSFYSIAEGFISDDVNGTDSQHSFTTCGSQQGSICPATMGGPSRDFGSELDTITCSNLSGASLPFADDSGTCKPLFAKRWDEYGFDSSQTGNEYLAGNPIEPFGISNSSQWNAIGTDAFLMDKSFELLQNIDFLGGAPTPIGGTSNNSFSGAVATGAFELKNISTSQPIFRSISSGALIGHKSKPFKVNGLTMNCGSQSDCGFIGKVLPETMNTGSNEAELVLEILGANVSSSSGECVGGLVGKADATLRFDKSGFQGQITGSGTGVGGFIGCLGNTSSSNSYDIRADIESSYVDASKITGNDFIGGFIGKLQSHSSTQSYLNVRDAFVVLDKTGTNKNNSIEAISASGGSNVGGIVGAVDLTSNSKFEIEKTYVDTSTAKLPTNYAHVGRVIAGSRTGNHYTRDFAIIWNATTNGSASSSYHYFSNSSDLSYIATSAADLSDGSNEFEASGDGRGDWWIDPNDTRVLQLDWKNPNYID